MKIMLYMRSIIIGFGMELTVCEVLFGPPTHNNSDLKLTNFLILIGKWFLNNTKTQNKPLYFLDFISLIKEKIEILKTISVLNNENVETWVDDLWAAI